MKYFKIILLIFILSAITLAILFFIFNEEENAFLQENYEKIEHEMILPFDYDEFTNPNVEAYPGKVQIQNLIVKNNMNGFGSPIIVAEYEIDSKNRELTIEYIQKNIKNFKSGDLITVAGEFVFEDKTYPSQKTETLWIVDFVADEVLKQKK